MLERIRYFIKRLRAKSRIKRRKQEVKEAIGTMNSDQKAIFDLVVDLAKTHPESILYDKVEKETLIVLPSLLVTLLSGERDKSMVYLDNHQGFHKQPFDPTAFTLLNDLIDKEAHRYRRKLKHEVRLNIRAFINGIIESRKTE